ncbi:MAG TPA: GNAT family protein [Propionibacteriaceae bacterium]|nr:GNAT family protein [Propionibacteriaceae bacterium]
MMSLAEVWPPYGVRVTEGDLLLSVIADEDIPGLVHLALSGIHPPEQMPFSTPWTDDVRADLPANNYRHYSRLRADCRPEAFTLAFAVRVQGRLVGVQSLTAQDFALTRTGETGSWLAMAHQGRGIGTRMRRAICAFAFDALEATELTSAAFLDNPASLAVSRKVGYRPNGTVRLKRRDNEVAINQKLVLTPDTFVRGAAVVVEGGAPLRTFLGLGP